MTAQVLHKIIQYINIYWICSQQPLHCYAWSIRVCCGNLLAQLSWNIASFTCMHAFLLLAASEHPIAIFRSNEGAVLQKISLIKSLPFYFQLPKVLYQTKIWANIDKIRRKWLTKTVETYYALNSGVWYIVPSFLFVLRRVRADVKVNFHMGYQSLERLSFFPIECSIARIK